MRSGSGSARGGFRDRRSVDCAAMSVRVVLRTLVVIVLALCVACSGTRESWAELRFEGIGFGNLFRSVSDLLGAEGYPVWREDPVAGRIETEWKYGESVHEVRGPSRSKVFAHVAPGFVEKEGEPPRPVWVVRVRVAEEVIRKGGMLARNERESSAWEEYRDNFERAEFLAEKIRTLLADQHVSVRTDGDAGASP